MDDLADRWLRAMARGIQARADLLAVVLPRMSPEYVVVASALHGLLAEIGDDPFDVRLEAPFHDKRHGKCDVVVTPRDGSEPFYFEFKALWPNGITENIGGIGKDLKKKIKGLSRGSAVAFSFALSVAPPGFDSKRSKKSADDAVNMVSAVLGQPAFRGEAFTVSGNGVVATACLVAWKAETPQA
jgi:hypothetical protein